MSKHQVAETHFQQQRYTEAAELYQELLQEAPTDCSLYLTLSSCFIHTHQLDEACVIAKNALLYASSPDMLSACKLQLGEIYKTQGRMEEAARYYEQILQTLPSHLKASCGLASIFLREGYPQRALKVLEPLKEQMHHDSLFIHTYSSALFESRQVNAALDFLLEHAQQQTLAPDLRSNALNFCQYTDKRVGYLAQLQALPVPTLTVSPAPISREKNAALRVGFISADFCLHPVGYFLHSFLGHLQEKGITIVLYSNGPKEDWVTQRLKNSASSFHSIVGLSTAQGLEKIRVDSLDILIDLSGHTAGNRLDIFARRAAPIQATYLGYPDSTYTSNIDYMMTDRFHVRENEHQHSSEKIVYLPATRFCFAPPLHPPEISELPFSKNRTLTFGCFSNVAKFSDACLTLWAQVLQAVPGSRLKLRHKSLVESEQKKDILRFFTQAGIAPGNIEFYPDCKYDSYLEAYSEVDVMLDTQPFSGATTTSEALWMGVPVLTLEGDFPAARQTASILKTIGAPEWVAQNAEEFVRIAVDLSEEVLLEFRKTSRKKILASPLGDPKLFAAQFYEVLNSLI